MKKLILLAVIAGFAFAAHAQEATKAVKKDAAQAEKMEMKAHVCTDACKDGKHVYKHGEKGHVCGEACHKNMKKGDGAMKEHTCTATCKDGKHIYKHGEKGHVCGDGCKKMKM